MRMALEGTMQPSLRTYVKQSRVGVVYLDVKETNLA